MSEQTAAANWARILPRLRRNAQELLEHGWEIREPPNAETPPHMRGVPINAEAGYSTGTGVVPAGKDGGATLPSISRTGDRE